MTSATPERESWTGLFASHTLSRERKLAAVSAFLNSIPRGPRALMFEGEASIGKRTTWFEALRLAQGREYHVLQLRPAESEAFSRILAGKLGPSGMRIICLRPHAIPEAVATSHTGEVFTHFAKRLDTTVDAILTDMANTTLLKRLPTLDEVANFAVFAATDYASAMTGAIANLTAGSLVD